MNTMRTLAFRTSGPTACSCTPRVGNLIVTITTPGFTLSQESYLNPRAPIERIPVKYVHARVLVRGAGTCGRGRGYRLWSAIQSGLLFRGDRVNAPLREDERSTYHRERAIPRYAYDPLVIVSMRRTDARYDYSGVGDYIVTTHNGRTYDVNVIEVGANA